MMVLGVLSTPPVLCGENTAHQLVRTHKNYRQLFKCMTNPRIEVWESLGRVYSTAEDVTFGNNDDALNCIASP